MPSSSSPPISAPAIVLQWACLSNIERADAFSARLTLINASGAALAPGWSIYFNSCRKTIPGSVAAGFTIDHINGDLFRLTSSSTAPWQPGVTLNVEYQARFWAISITDAPLGFYLVPATGAPVDLGHPQIAPFATGAQQQRGKEDFTPTMDAAARYRDNAGLALLPAGEVGRLTPRPVAARFDGAMASLSRSTSIVFSQGLASEAALLRAILDTLALPPADGNHIARIVLDTGAVELAGGAPAAPHEAYALDIGASTIHIRGATGHGVCNGIQSLRQMIDAGAVPQGRVLDAPRFAYRGFMLDVARHFASKDTVLRLLDCMALYKLNRFHFHLTDDEGWRFPVAELPELTAIGARRGVSLDESPCLPPSFGSGARIDGSAGTGFYSADDFIAILRYAHARHIEVIPECNVPGHARAAIVAMRARHQRLLALGDHAGAERFLLDDAADQSRYESVQLWRDNVICIALPSADRFFDTVVGALAALYEQAGVPLRAVHTGGDEVPNGAWQHSPACQALMKKQGWSTLAQLRGDFVARCHAILARRGIAYAGWEETALDHAVIAPGAPDAAAALVPSTRFAGAGFQVYAWNNAWGWGQEDLAYRLANAGYQVVLSNAANLYFDLACAKQGDEPGYYWAGFVSARDTFVFSPLDIGATPGSDPMGVPLPPARIAAFTRLDAAGARRILGLQGQLWAENANTRERIEYLAAPRLIALAERAWSPDPGWSAITAGPARARALDAAWNEFANRLGQRVLPHLDQALAFGYRLPPPGVSVARGGQLTVSANVALPGLHLHYTVDGSAPDLNSPRYTTPVVCPPGSQSFQIAAFDTRGRRSRSVSINLKNRESDEQAPAN
jgi:hexosaminidase